jgi:hypothetical protein
MVTTPDGRYFFLYHAYNTATNVFTGRQGLMDEVVWDAGTGWPSFRYGKIPSIQATAPHAGTVQHDVADFSDRFEHAALGIEWIWDASQNKPAYQTGNGQLILNGNNSPAGNFLGLRPRRDSYTLQVTMEKGATPAGISIYGTKDQAIGLSQIGGNRVELWQVERGVRTVLAAEDLPETEKIVLFLETRFGQYCRFGFIRQDGQPQPTGALQHIRRLPQWDRPPMIGIHAGGDGAGIFDEVQIQYAK